VPRELKLNGQQFFRLEPRPDLLKPPEVSDEQTGAHQQHQCQRYLRNHQQTLKPLAPS